MEFAGAANYCPVIVGHNRRCLVGRGGRCRRLALVHVTSLLPEGAGGRGRVGGGLDPRQVLTGSLERYWSLGGRADSGDTRFRSGGLLPILGRGRPKALYSLSSISSR